MAKLDLQVPNCEPQGLVTESHRHWGWPCAAETPASPLRFPLLRVLPGGHHSLRSPEHPHLWNECIYLLHFCAKCTQKVLPERTLGGGLARPVQVFRNQLWLQTFPQGAWELNLSWTNQRNPDRGGKPQPLTLRARTEESWGIPIGSRLCWRNIPSTENCLQLDSVSETRLILAQTEWASGPVVFRL